MDYHQPDFYKFNDDSTFLLRTLFNDFSPRSSVMSILDLCAGCGLLGIEAGNYFEQTSQISFVEIQKEFQPYLNLNLQNMLTKKIETHCFHESFEVAPKQKYDLVLCNPPYFEVEDSRVSSNRNRSIARHFIHGTLHDLILTIIESLQNSSSRAYILIRNDHSGFEGVKFEFRDLIEKIVPKGRVSLFVFKYK